MYLYRSIVGAALLAAVPFTTGQTFSSCNPMQKNDCPSKPGLDMAVFTSDFTQGPASLANWTSSTNGITSTPQGAKFSISKLGDSPTIMSNFYMFFGYVEVEMMAAPGKGIVSSAVMESDDLDELDWEIIGSENGQAQTDYFGKGNTTKYDRGASYPVSMPQSTFHTYAVNWTKEMTTWLIDGTPVRVVKFDDALNGQNYPQTPMNIRLGAWVGGDPNNSPGTIQWAGGLANFAAAPFDMYVKSVKVMNYNPAVSYSYGDNSGGWQSIKVSQEPAKAAVVVPAPVAKDASSAAQPAPVTVMLGPGGSASSSSGLSSNSISAVGTTPATLSSSATATAAAGGAEPVVTISISEAGSSQPAAGTSVGGVVPVGTTATVVSIGIAGQGTNSTLGASVTGASGAPVPTVISVGVSGQGSPTSGGGILTDSGAGSSGTAPSAFSSNTGILGGIGATGTTTALGVKTTSIGTKSGSATAAQQTGNIGARPSRSFWGCGLAALLAVAAMCA